MDRISALRNVEEAIAAFEDGEATLDELEDRVTAVVRTYATEFSTGTLAAYRVEGPDRSVVLVADSPGSARRRATDRHDMDPVTVDRVGTADDRQ